MELTDALSHNIISHRRDSDEPITKAVSKYRIQTLSSLTEQVILRPQHLVRRDTQKGCLGPALVNPAGTYIVLVRNKLRYEKLKQITVE